jgi:hypothetical protein
MQAAASGARRPDPWLVRQICDELDRMKTAGEDIPDGAYSLAEDMDHLIDQGVSPRIVAEHAAELARSLDP